MATAVPDTLAVIGAGTMGAGIAQLAAQAGMRTLLHDPDPDALASGLDAIGATLDRAVVKGRLDAATAAGARSRLQAASSLSDLAGAGLVVEAAPERLDLKLRLFAELSEIVAADCVLATNTSSLSVTEIAAGTPGPERVVGMHFFNPATVMRLMEVVAGEQTGPAAVETARAVGEAMGKHVISAPDVAGFLVNRCNRPYSLEALHVLEQRIADPGQIDRIARLAGAFRMGPFELMDLIGIDTNHAVAEGLRRQSYGEPRYRPSPLAARKIAAGRLGRKTGHGWYRYPAPPPEAVETEPAPAGDGDALVVAGTLPVAVALREHATAAGWAVVAAGDARAARARLVLDCSDGRFAPPAGVPVARLLHRGSLHAIDPRAAGFHVLPPLEHVRALEVTTTPLSDPASLAGLRRFAGSLGWAVEEVGDAPGLVLGRIVAQLVNEAAFLVGEGNGTPEDVDSGMRLGVNHPRGPVEWGERIGAEHVAGLLRSLQRELGEERYRVAPLLARREAIERAISAR